MMKMLSKFRGENRNSISPFFRILNHVLDIEFLSSLPPPRRYLEIYIANLEIKHSITLERLKWVAEVF